MPPLDPTFWADPEPPTTAPQPRFTAGMQIFTVPVDGGQTHHGWQPKMLLSRKWNVTGIVTQKQENHGPTKRHPCALKAKGLIYTVKHTDGSTGYYVHNELFMWQGQPLTPQEVRQRINIDGGR